MGKDEAPGWDAIDAALDAVYAGQEPRHFGTVVKYALGGRDPIDGISVYANDAPRPHWHFVTYGFSELYGKENGDPEVSGFGFELTFRLARGASEDEPPMWPINFLQNLARYVFGSGNPFGYRHHLNLNGPIAVDQSTGIRAIVFARDPALGSIATVHGALAFLQVVGLTLDEYALIKQWDSEALIGVLAAADPMLLTDLDRPSLLDDPARAAEIRARVDSEGSSMATTFVKHLEIARRWRKVEVTIGAVAVDDLVQMLASRLGHGRPFKLSGPDAGVVLNPGDAPGWKAKGSSLVTIAVPEPLAREMRASLHPRRGTYAWDALPGLAIKVVPTEIKDSGGKVLRVVG